MSKEHTYTNGEVTIVWRSDRCIHSRKCWHGLPEVFKPGERPWIKPEGQATERIIAQVKECPSGALTFHMNGSPLGQERSDQAPVRIDVSPNGPLLVPGPCVVKHADGRTEVREKVTALCRCGASANKPFCDGSHRKIEFEG